MRAGGEHASDEGGKRRLGWALEDVAGWRGRPYRPRLHPSLFSPDQDDSFLVVMPRGRAARGREQFDCSG